MFLILLAMRLAAAVYRWCQRWLPSNILIRRVRTRAGLRFGIPLALLGGVYFIAGLGCLGAVRLGGPGWWYLAMAVCWWTAAKLIGHGLYATLALPVVRVRENLAVRRAIREASARPGGPRQVWTPQRRRQLTREVRADLLHAEGHARG
jgi:hypothetical protein